MDKKTCEKYYKVINNDSQFIIFFRDINCQFCRNTFLFLKQNNASYRAFKIENKEIFLECLMKGSYNINPYHNTFPIIFYKKKFIGGYTELLSSFNLNNFTQHNY